MEWTTHPWVEAGRGRVRLGVGVTTAAPAVDWPTRAATARAAEALGVDSLWVPDHPLGTTDCWTALAALAAVTGRVRLGPMVSCVLYRPPWATARQAADVDRLSGGRLVLGLGTGWVGGEFEHLGVPFPPPAERHRALEATLAEVERRWYGRPVEVEGPLAAMTFRGDGLLWPPVQEPRVPLLIGGAGEQLTLKQVARYADMCSLEAGRAPTPEEVGRKLGVLRAHCEAIGRPYASIVRSHFENRVILAPTEERARRKLEALPPVYRNLVAAAVRTPRQLVEHYRPLIAAGVQYLVVNLATHDDVETVELLAERVMPELQDLAETA
jgi:alkanesulfonate monooxygenase SsuD/methylene tetrahydromethanopterin reductase-like flavin-dependent oxidoreductase (luciferase family)